MLKRGFILLTLLIPLNIYSGNKCLNTTYNYAKCKVDKRMQPKKQITVECWLKADKYSNWGAPMSYIYDNGHDESGYAIAMYQDKLRFMVKTVNMKSQDWNHNPGITPQYNQWFHFAGVYDGEAVKVYYNGELAEAKYVDGDIDWTFKPYYMSIGAFVDSNELNYFKGSIDELRVWNRALNQDEIKKFMNNTPDNDNRSLIAYYKFDGNDGTISDNTNNKFHGSIINYSNNNRMVSHAFMRPLIKSSDVSDSDKLSLSWSKNNINYNIDNYEVEISSDKKFANPDLRKIKTENDNINIDKITGGKRYYIRVKAYSASFGYSAYSDITETEKFSNSFNLSINVVNNYNSSKFDLIKNNTLINNSLKIESGKTIIINSSVFNINPDIRGKASIAIKTPTKDLTFEITESSNIVLTDIKGGNYTIKALWGNDFSLNKSISFFVKDHWYRSKLFYIVILILIIAIVFYIFLKYRFINKKKLTELKDIVEKPEASSESLSDDQKEILSERLEKCISDKKPHLHAGITIKNLSEMSDIPTYELPKLISEKYGQNFNDYINQLRVSAVIEEFKTPGNNELLITTIATNCGFNSEATFYRVFKKITGLTPKEYQKKILIDNAKKK